jgi:hypothetical protein
MNSVCVVKEAVRELIFTLVASLLCLCPIAAQAYSGGAGTDLRDSPEKITTYAPRRLSHRGIVIRQRMWLAKVAAAANEASER